MNFAELKETMPFKWKVNNNIGNKVLCVAYVDSRQVQDKLDEVCGPENWTDDYKVVNGNMYAGVGINVGDTKDPRWVWKWDCGTESNTEKEKGESSDAFKRAAVKWGVGRFLYTMDMHKLDTKEYGSRNKKYPTDDKGNILWDGQQLTDYINKKFGNGASKVTPTPTVGMDSGGSGSYKGHKDITRYDASKGGADVKYQSSHNFSDETIKKVQALSRDGKKGREVLKEYIPEFNKKFSTSFTSIMDFSTDKLLVQLIEFVEETPPKALGK